MKLQYILSSVVAALLLVSACTPEEYKMGDVDVDPSQLVDGDGFTVNMDQSTNYVTFTSNLPSDKSVYWEYGPKPADGSSFSVAGNSTAKTYKVGIAFPGDYYMRMGVETRGGIIYSEPTYFHVDKMNTNFISDPLWTVLTGGVGNSKTWVLDLDASGASIYFGGPKWFYTAGQSWDSFHNAAGENYLDADAWDATSAIDPSLSGEWYWAADIAGNGWICGAADYGEMTFDLINGANVTVNGSTGSYNMDVATHTISFTGVLPLNCGVDGSIQGNCPAGAYKIIYMNENAMQILFDGPAETPFTMNYIAKSYKDNYVPAVNTDIILPANWMDYMAPMNQNRTTYKFDDETPFTWFDVSGETEIKREFAPADVADYKFEFDNRANVLNITTPDDQNYSIAYYVQEGDINEEEGICVGGGLYLFDETLPKFVLGADNKDICFGGSDKLQLLSYEIDDFSGDVTNIVLAQPLYDAQGNFYEYIAFNLKKQTGGAEVERLPVTLGYAGSDFVFITHEKYYVTGEGTYTFTLVPDGVVDTQAPYLYYIDIAKLLKKHPNADITITSIKVDGNEILGSQEGFDDATIARGVGDEATTGRRYLLNPWNEDSALHTDLFKFSTSFDVTVNVRYDVGEVVLK